ncbi:RNA polymerase sigma-70 factor [Flavobacterium sp. 9AF]|uniref:RNA polymerase sigma factor n=1 Tax=Flavobacterium sp. 9AF TaxID=2653142 RepID=UPI0012F0E30E|nr:sigma-70 family RNA polymerase sigma factor [Flavobacterium sp. 9AF]VXB53930.1 RNA polymerase sigma-70 factor [Flavobacterium sp. 9AF]
MEEKNNICEEKIFTAFFKKNVKPLRNYILYKFGNEELAEDIVQEAFTKLWQNCKNIPIEKGKSYIYRVANNASLNVVSHQKVVLEYTKNNVNDERHNENPEFLYEQEEFKKKLIKAINTINETQRIAFLMHRIDGKKYAEIAEELNISVKAVEKRIHLALIQIKKEIVNFK